MNGFFPRLYFKSNGLSRFSQVFYTSIHLYDPEVANFVTILMILLYYRTPSLYPTLIKKATF